MKKICEYATNRDFTDVIVLNENRKTVNGLLLIHLPGGPTAHFKLSSLRLSKDIKVLCSNLPAIILYDQHVPVCNLDSLCWLQNSFHPIEASAQQLMVAGLFTLLVQQVAYHASGPGQSRGKMSV